MPVGNAVTAAQYNGLLGGLGVELTQWLQKVDRAVLLNTDLGGNVAGLTSIGFSAGDAQAAIDLVNTYAAAARVLRGEQSQPAANNFTLLPRKAQGAF